MRARRQSPRTGDAPRRGAHQSPTRLRSANLRKLLNVISVDVGAWRRPALSQLAPLPWGTVGRFDVGRRREPGGAKAFCHDLDRFRGAVRPAVP